MPASCLTANGLVWRIEAIVLVLLYILGFWARTKARV
jgi:hypothetical protein